MKKDSEFTKLSSERRKFLKKLVRGTLFTGVTVWTVQLQRASNALAIIVPPFTIIQPITQPTDSPTSEV